MDKKSLLKLQNVNGFVEEDDKVTVFVTKKLSMNRINKLIKDSSSPWKDKDVIPKNVVVARKGLLRKGIEKKTDVIQLGHVRALSDRKQYDPLIGGVEIGLFGKPFVGTAGMVVTLEKYGNLLLSGQFKSFGSILRKFGLTPVRKNFYWTNAHVANESVLSQKNGSAIQQSPLTKRRCGIVAFSLPMKKVGLNEFDDAFVELYDMLEVRNNIVQVGEPSGFGDPIKGDKVEKYGRTSGYSKGTFSYRGATLKIDYGDGVGELEMTGLDWFKLPSSPGDSGSVIVRESDKVVVSHLFAGNGQGDTFGIPSVKVKDRVGFELYKEV